MAEGAENPVTLGHTYDDTPAPARLTSVAVRRARDALQVGDGHGVHQPPGRKQAGRGRTGSTLTGGRCGSTVFRRLGEVRRGTFEKMKRR